MNAINMKPMREKTQTGICNRSDFLVCPNIYRVGISGLGSSSGLFLGALLLLVDDGMPLGMALGGFGAGLELLSLLFLELLHPVHLHLLVNVLRFLV